MIIIPTMTMIILPNMMHPKILHNTLRKTKNMNKNPVQRAGLLKIAAPRMRDGRNF